ncbi:MAG: SIMPL domain-containing protein [Dethiobacteria bacterium]|jgi:uncharacterized protein YggE
MKREHIILACVGLFLLAGVLIPIFAINSTAGASASDQFDIIGVYGEAEILAEPDSAKVILAVETTHETAKKAVEENARLTNAVLDALVQLGLDKEQCKTSSYQLNSFTQTDPKNKEKYITKYQAYNELNVSLSNLDEVGNVIDTAVAAGANRVLSVYFERKDADNLKLMALQNATQQAKAKAEAIAAGAGITIKGVKVIYEEMTGYTPYRADMNENFQVMKAVADMAPTPMLPDDVKVTARVKVDYFF